MSAATGQQHGRETLKLLTHGEKVQREKHREKHREDGAIGLKKGTDPQQGG